MKRSLTALAFFALAILVARAMTPRAETASWYGESHRGRLMANGKPFNPDALTAASWFYPLGTKVCVCSGGKHVHVSITDRGPAQRLVEDGRIIDLSHAAFLALQDPDVGIIDVKVRPVHRNGLCHEEN